MKYIAILLFTVLTSFSSAETSVYICGSNGAKKYHFKETCRGLSSCSREIVKTTLSQAKNKGLTICGWED